ncbi:MAG: hypothetical protein PHX60_06825 [Giesbergeria sp.]|uniref:hypothetical protein n=1 Tax=Giesbergeria sp. TaxID=2818473 RepID=UPI0026355D54|nr:hypothetical protein [Giesbergeria sp.]MDD2609398.1 hypothetical protein [Giesbergeria sp.]
MSEVENLLHQLLGDIIVFILFLAITTITIFWVPFYVKTKKMNPEERKKYIEELQRKKHEKYLQNAFGCTNPKLICPHCQIQGTIRAKSEKRLLSTTGKIGGILKTNTTSTTIQHVTQHHCDNCGSTWDI